MKAFFRKRLNAIFPDSEDGLKLLRSMNNGDTCEVHFDNQEERSLSMNALSHVWYNDAAKYLKELPIDIKSECKLLYGVPILRAEDDQFREFYDGAIKKALSYEQKLAAMRFIPVTSIMNKNQMYRYLTDMQTAYSKNHQLVLKSQGEYERWLAKKSG